jgi:tetratricopeptide (TPR) repeat protein
VIVRWVSWVKRTWEARGAGSVSAAGGVAAGGDIRDSPITINQSDNTEILRQGKETQDLIRQLLAQGPAQAAPEAERRVGEAIGEIARGAEGDARLRDALDLLKVSKVAEATRLLRDVAEDKAARIAIDRKEAAAAYRHLGAIAGLGNPKDALEAYQKAIEFDPDDTDSLLWAGWLDKDRGQLNNADRHFRRVMTLSEFNEQTWSGIGRFSVWVTFKCSAAIWPRR